MSRFTRRTGLAFLAVAVLGVAAWLADLLGFSNGPPRNLILISVDTLRADHLGAYGYPEPTSPRLDDLARRGTLFRHAFAPGGWTVPSHMSAFTGLDPAAHRLVAFPDAGRLGGEYVTLAETLRAAGFRTAAFTGGGFMSPQHGFEDGFERFTSRGRHFETKLGDVRDWIERAVAEGRRRSGEGLPLLRLPPRLRRPPALPSARRLRPEVGGARAAGLVRARAAAPRGRALPAARGPRRALEAPRRRPGAHPAPAVR
jgi:hypothetical protein